MNKSNQNEFPWTITRRIGAFISFLFSLVIYVLTVQPTVSFWDCGERIACAHSLSVPHPPGTPLFTLLGKAVSLIPVPLSVAHKINLISSFLGALTIGLIFLILARLIEKWFIKITKWSQALIAFSGAFAGSMLSAFSHSHWQNTTEAEVYASAIFCFTLSVYLALRWYDRRKKANSERYLVLIPVVLYLGLTIHKMALIALPAIFLFIIIVSPEKRRDYVFWFTWIVLGSSTLSFSVFYKIIALGLLVSGLGAIFATKNDRFKRSFLTIFLAAIIFASYLMIPIRSSHNPPIDENDPETWKSFKSYMARKQYGNRSKLEMLFTRKGDWQHQFGVCFHEPGDVYYNQSPGRGGRPRSKIKVTVSENDKGQIVHKAKNMRSGNSRTIRKKKMLLNMGFWRQYARQFSEEGVSAYGIIPFIILIFGLVWQFLRDKKRGTLFLLVFLVSTLGLLIYMNFSDGLNGIRMEVRERDYFYTSGFLFMGAAIGMGLAAIAHNLLESSGGRISAFVVSIIFMASSIYFPLDTHYHTHDRSNNYIPYDYAYNILQSCTENSIIFTNGDNDTFPVWFAQVVKDVRPDVKVVNLSLLNTSWYIKQLKHQMDVPITYSDETIDGLRPRPTNNGFVKVQDIMVRHIISNTKWVENKEGELECQPPVYFAVTVAPSNKLDYKRYLSMEGLAYRLVPQKGKRQVTEDIMEKKLFEVYRYRGLNDPDIYKDHNSQKLLQNYNTAFMTLALEQKREGKKDEAIKTMEKSTDLLPFNWRSGVYLANLYSQQGNVDKAMEIYEKAKKQDRREERVYTAFANIFYSQNMKDKAIEILREAHRLNPDNFEIVRYLSAYLRRSGKEQESRKLIRSFMAENPEIRERYMKERQQPGKQGVPQSGSQGRGPLVPKSQAPPGRKSPGPKSSAP